MLVRSLFLIYAIFDGAGTQDVPATSLRKVGQDKVVNSAIITVLEENNRNNLDLKTIENVQKFIGQVKNVINSNVNLRRQFSTHVKLEKFTDFIYNVIQILLKYDDVDLEYFFVSINDEIRNYHYKGCKFYELTENYSLRKFVAKKLDKIKNVPAKVLRKQLKAVAIKIKDEDYEDLDKELIDFINSFYMQDSIAKFQKFLINIDDYRLKTKNYDLDLIIREGVRSIIFDHYTELNRNARVSIKSKIYEYWKQKQSKIPRNGKHKSMSNDETYLKFRNGKRNPNLAKTTIRHFRQYDQEYDELNPKFRTTMKNRFISLYPELIRDDSKLSSQQRKAEESDDSSMSIFWQEKSTTKANTPLALRNNGNRDTQKSRLEIVTMRPYKHLKLVTSKLKYEISLKTPSTKPSPKYNHQRKSIGRLTVDVPLPKQIKWLRSQVDHRRSFEGDDLSMQQPITNNNTNGNKKRQLDSNYHDDDTLSSASDDEVVNEKLLTRLQNLEKEISVVKTQLKNDTEIIKDLNIQVTAKNKENKNKKYNGNEKNTEKNLTSGNQMKVMDHHDKTEQKKSYINHPARKKSKYLEKTYDDVAIENMFLKRATEKNKSVNNIVFKTKSTVDEILKYSKPSNTVGMSYFDSEKLKVNFDKPNFRKDTQANFLQPKLSSFGSRKLANDEHDLIDSTEEKKNEFMSNFQSTTLKSSNELIVSGFNNDLSQKYLTGSLNESNYNPKLNKSKGILFDTEKSHYNKLSENNDVINYHNKKIESVDTPSKNQSIIETYSKNDDPVQKLKTENNTFRMSPQLATDIIKPEDKEDKVNTTEKMSSIDVSSKKNMLATTIPESLSTSEPLIVARDFDGKVQPNGVLENVDKEETKIMSNNSYGSFRRKGDIDLYGYKDPIELQDFGSSFESPGSGQHMAPAPSSGIPTDDSEYVAGEKIYYLDSKERFSRRIT